MLASFQEVFCPTPEQQKASEERHKRLVQRLIDNHDCYYCKHARLEDRIEHGCYAG